MAAARSNLNRMQAARAVPFRGARFWMICFFFFVWTTVIFARMFWLQVVRHREYLERAQKQQQRTFEVAPRRGVLYDRNLRELAMTVQVDSIYAVPGEVEDKKAAAQTLAAIVHTDPDDFATSEEQIANRLGVGRSFAWIARRVTPEVSAKVQALVKSGDLKGIYFQKEFQRFYPDNQIAAQVLGYVGIDDNGLGGLEQKFESLLHGVPGRMFTAVDARRHALSSSEREPAPGRNLQLTIDERIQYLAERALDRAMEKYHPDNGTVVVQDVHTGQILALAIRPTFDPNQFRHTTQGLLRNHAVSDAYEPGSTFKLLTYSAALNEHVTSPGDIVDCQGSLMTLNGRVIHDDKGDHFGKLTIADALAHSSNVAAVKTALKIGPNRFYQYIRDFGFGSRTGLELPGETRGLLRPVNQWSQTSIGSVAMGQEVGVTPIQLVTMVSTIANGGVYLPPHILMPGQVGGSPQSSTLKAAPFHPNYELPSPLPQGAHRVISELAAAQMRQMMAGVVEHGTGRDAQLNGYSSGGKTGTAQKIDPATHRYSKEMHVASFAGIAPVNNPVIAVAVVLDNPHGSYYGATVSAPVFADVAQQILEYLGVPHDSEVHANRAAEPLPAHLAAEDEGDRGGDIGALYTAINSLPADDPLRGGDVQHSSAGKPNSAPHSGTPPPQKAAGSGKPAQAGAATGRPGGANAPTVSTSQNRGNITAKGAGSAPTTRTVVVNESKKLRVPLLIGLPVRKVVEQAAAAGLEVQITGSGVVREQLPAAGTMVSAGTQIVVRCSR